LQTLFSPRALRLSSAIAAAVLSLAGAGGACGIETDSGS
jgi:hypothetical protein